MKYLTALAACVTLALATDNRRHFYTTNGADYSTSANGKYQYAGVSGWVYQSQQPATVPMYQCYNGPSDLHFYTTASNCEGAANYNNQGVAYYIYQGAGTNRCTYQRFSQSNGDHWYSCAQNVQGAADQQYYNYEGVAGYIFSSQVSGSSPLYAWVRGTDY